MALVWAKKSLAMLAANPAWFFCCCMARNWSNGMDPLSKHEMGVWGLA
jgi:hypothetical protein